MTNINVNQLSRAGITGNGTPIVGGGTKNPDTLIGRTENGTNILSGQPGGKDMFFNLLVAEMSNQDPFAQDQDPTKYVTQLAQFSTLEQMQHMSSALESVAMLANGLLINSAVSTASGLLGKEAEFAEIATEGENAGKEVITTGVVQSVEIENGIVYMEVKLENGETKKFKYESFVKVMA